MTSWSCQHELNGICKRVDGAYCRPGMKGCVLVGKVKFEDGVIPSPIWPPGRGPGRPEGDGTGTR
jgi:hypothetical protein